MHNYRNLTFSVIHFNRPFLCPFHKFINAFLQLQFMVISTVTETLIQAIHV